MITRDEVIAFRPEILSGRERQILDLAIEGHTDEQISRTLDISTSTVNSYWVRIRGKIGPLSRTEIVSKMLRLGFSQIQAQQISELQELRDRLAENEARLADVESELRTHQRGVWTASALHHLPEAVLIAQGDGDVVYANREAERMFSRPPGEMEGLQVCDLTTLMDREAKREQIRVFMAAGVAGRMRLGFDEPCYAESSPEDSFRATITAEGFDGPDGFMAAFTVREIVSDLEAIVRSLRWPYAT